MSASRPTVHWIYAHPQEKSFNARLFRDGVEALSRDHDVEITDLYGQGFDPVLAAPDLGEPLGREGSVVDLMGEAYAVGQLPSDVIEEQRKLGAADLVVLQFPLWWYGPPAILKGWFDRVLTNGFAYGPSDPETGLPLRYGDGPLAGRRALVIVTAGEDDRSIGERGVSGDLDSLLFPLTHGTLWYTGIEPLDLHVVHDADGLEPAQVDLESARLVERLSAIGDESPTSPYRRLRDGEYHGTRALRADLLPGRTDLGIHRVPID
ncbi:NAD(P)H-dependent oxidoreductase [Microbacterium phyllosphaerae]|uniref:NAD(P)H-dependent oxidoreductase n=1 Tax=Microbacterium phyllosphaerae TaxID=124798 RepID=UPI00216777FF|nr:NAD(P)H-dependent oxidoreductase [Microbacterium phyllosphaerae]MCS3442951.1 NAD(P)H dehydrogenase (quinone) [Microbacterium phyllosphaerae]